MDDCTQSGHVLEVPRGDRAATRSATIEAVVPARAREATVLGQRRAGLGRRNRQQLSRGSLKSRDPPASRMVYARRWRRL